MNIELIHTEDIEVIKRLLRKDNIHMGIGNRYQADGWEPDIVNWLWYQVIIDNQLTGLIFIKKLFDNCIVFHGAVYKSHRGPKSAEYLKMTIQTLKTMYQNYVFVSHVPKNNKLAAAILKRAGFVYKTTIKNGYPETDLLLFAEE